MNGDVMVHGQLPGFPLGLVHIRCSHLLEARGVSGTIIMGDFRVGFLLC